METRCSVLVVISAGAILALTGLAKLWSALGTAKVLVVADPLLGISYKHLLAGVAVMEIVAATICFFGRSREWTVALVAYLRTGFMLYRPGLWWIGWKQPRGCMGSLTGALQIKPKTVDNVALILLFYMLTTSYALLFMQWKNRFEPTQTTAASLESASL